MILEDTCTMFHYYYHLGGKGSNESTLVVTQEEMERYNQKAEGNGSWTLMNGKVYNIDSLSEQVSKQQVLDLIIQQ